MKPIAITGMGCRFPKANNPEAFWQLLRNGQQAISSVPASRWSATDFYDPNPKAAGKTSSCRGGFLDDIEKFDAAFFGISPEEAHHIDPQQRLFLEIAWEALEHAGIAPLGLSDSATGVFSGLCTIDYHRLLYRDFSAIGPHSGTGTTMSITANRLSYLLNLRGPSMAVDAACSSSLVAIHLACQSLRSGESNLCLAGGVNLILSPDSMISSSQTGLLSKEGACRPFDSEADGYVRGEGCGIVILKRLEDAQANGDSILALIRGSAVNQDGLSNSLTAPNGLAQQGLIQRALAVSEVLAQDIDYIEAHAVGTPLGDAVEFKALKKALKSEREKPCFIGSVKSNIGHLEAASGVAGLIKVILSLQHEEIPPQLNFEQANPYVDIEESSFEISPMVIPWQRQQSRRRVAGVSTFGFGGTNAHFVIEEAPLKSVKAQPENSKDERPCHLLALTAKSPASLRELAQRYVRLLSDSAEESAQNLSQARATNDDSSVVSARSLADICFTANTGRSHFNERLCLISNSHEQLQQRLTRFCEGKETELAGQFLAGQVKGRKRPRLAFYFPEPTLGTLRLGQVLYASQPIFQAVFDGCVQRSASLVSLDASNWSQTAEKLTLSAAEKMTARVVSYALAVMWQFWGVQPKAFVGAGIGKQIADCAAGLIEVEEMLLRLSSPELLSEPAENWAEDNSLSDPSFSPELTECDIALSMGSGPEGEPPLEGYLAAPYQGQVAHLPLRTEMDIWPQLLSHLACLFVKGIEVDWLAFDKGYARNRLPLPTYPFERSRYWFNQAPSLTAPKIAPSKPSEIAINHTKENSLNHMTVKTS